jgi:TonB family protein
MTARLVLANLTAFALQTTVLVALGAALARMLRIDAPKALLAYWRTLLCAVLLLPFCQPWLPGPSPAVVTATVTAAVGTATATDVATAPLAQSSAWRAADASLALLLAGLTVRVLWLIAGAFELRRLRRGARPLDPLPDSVRRAQEQTGTAAGMYVSERVAGPITFGVLRPIVLFPPSVTAMPAHIQNAIACHELLHVRRRDWVQDIVEEGVRCALWFHPAIWWLIGRVRLAREEVVDQATIQLTDSRERYVESLLAVAVAQSRVTFTPASPFLRRRLLKKRIARILQESTMTTRRLIASFTASTAALVLAGAFATRSFPLQAQNREAAASGAPVQVLSGGDHLLHGDLPEYPERAIHQKVEGDVVVEMTLNNGGEVADAHVLSGPEALRKATLEAVLQWHYAPDTLSATDTQATLRFQLPAGGIQTVEYMNKVHVLGGPVEERVAHAKAEYEPQLAEHQLVEMAKMLEDPGTTATQRAELEAKVDQTKRLLEKLRAEEHEKEQREFVALERHGVSFTHAEPGSEQSAEAQRLLRIRSERVSEAMVKELLTQSGVAVGDPISRETIERLRQAAAAIDEHFRVEVERTPAGTVLTLLTR